MRIMLNTNILISALEFGGKTKLLLENLVLSEHEILVSEYVCNEFTEKLKQKWPDKSEKLVYILETVTLNLFQGLFNSRFRNEFGMTLNRLIRDKKDVPVLSGFAYFIENEETVFILFLAVNPELRSKDYNKNLASHFKIFKKKKRR